MAKKETSSTLRRPGPVKRLMSGPNTKWNLVLMVLVVTELVVFGMANPRFLSLKRLLTAANDDLMIWFAALFVTFVMITGGIDIQSCAIMNLTSVVMAVTWQSLGLNIWLAVVVGIIAAGLCGALSGFFVAYCGVQAMVVTLGGSFLYAGLALVIFNLSGAQAHIGIKDFPPEFLALAKIKLFKVIPLPILIFVVMLAIAYFLLHRSKYGRKVFLVGVNPSAAEYSGINSRLVIMSTYILSSLAAAVAGVVLTAQLGMSKSNLAGNFTMIIITACVLGGTLSTGGKGSVIGTALAAMVYTLLRFGMYLGFNIPRQYMDIPIGILLVVVVVGRAIANNPNVAATLSKLKPKKKTAA